MTLQQNLPNCIEVLNDKDQELTFSGRLTLDDYQAALYLHHRPHRLIGLFQIFLVVGYLGAIALHGVKNLSALSLTVLTFPLFLLMVWRAIFFDSQVQASFERHVSLSYQYDFRVTPEKIWISSLREAFEFDWSAFSYYKTNRALTLLYRSDNEFYIFPNHWFPSLEEAQWFHRHLLSVLGDPVS